MKTGRIIYKFDEQSKAVTASAGIELDTSWSSNEELDVLVEHVARRSEELMKRAINFSQELTMKHKIGGTR